MRERESVLSDAAGVDRTQRARSEEAVFREFRKNFELEDVPEAVALYLTWLRLTGCSGRAIRVRLQRLDLDRRLRGLPPWRQDPDIRVFLRGLHASSPFGEGSNHYDPLYLDLVHAMVDVCRIPTNDQRRAHAARLLRTHTELSAASLVRLRWRDVRLTRHRLEFAVTTSVGRGSAATMTHRLDAIPGSPDCPVNAVRALRALDSGPFVLGADNRQLDVNRLGRWLSAGHPLPPRPAQVRDPALLLIGYGAGLRTTEAMSLRQQDVQTHDLGLVLSIAGRERLTYLPSHPDPAYDPPTAWSAWFSCMSSLDRLNPHGLAFPATNFSIIFRKGLTEAGLNGVIQRRTDEAEFAGRYVWTSLRTGMIRTAIRNGVQPHVIAAHADLTSLSSVMRHERRENLLGERSIAARLGL